MPGIEVDEGKDNDGCAARIGIPLSDCQHGAWKDSLLAVADL